jgi:peptidoglycan/xylan/chitin deacetylase (PgdA/CDA1 family)
VRFSGLAWLVRNTVARRRVSIVLYHDPDPAALDAQLAYLVRRYSAIPFDRLVSAIRSNNWASLPPRSVVITLDDGHARNLRLLSSFRRHGVRPTLYLRTDTVGAAGWLSRDEVKTISDGCDVGSHTRSHPALPAVSPARAKRELGDSKREVETLTGRPCSHFAYPAGAYSDPVADMARAAGYDSARTVDIGWTGEGSDPYRLKVLSIDPPSPTRLAADLAGMSRLTRLLLGKADLAGRRRFSQGGAR